MRLRRVVTIALALLLLVTALPVAPAVPRASAAAAPAPGMISLAQDDPPQKGGPRRQAEETSSFSTASTPISFVTIGQGTTAAPMRINVGTDASYQVFFNYGDTLPAGGQIYPPDGSLGDDGTLLRIGARVYGPNFGARRTATGSGFAPYTEVSQTRAGTGTSADPYTVITRVMAGPILMDETVTLVDGDHNYKISRTLTNTSRAEVAVTIFHAADLHLKNNDSGYGYYDTTSGGVGGYDLDKDWYEVFTPIDSPNGYQEASYEEIWNRIGIDWSPGGGLTNNILADSYLDNGIALSWDRTIQGGGSTTVRDSHSFGRTATPWDRDRHSIASWVPQAATVETREGLDDGGGLVWVIVRFGWDNATQMRELTGPHRGFEVKLRVDSGFASNVVRAHSNFGGYLDTPAFDNTCCTFGWGTADPSVFRPGVVYEVEFQLNGNTKPPTEPSPMGLDFQVTSDSQRGKPEFVMPPVRDLEWFVNTFAPLLPNGLESRWEDSQFLADLWEYAADFGTYPWRMFGDSMYTMIRTGDCHVRRDRNNLCDGNNARLNVLRDPDFEGSNPLKSYRMGNPRNNRNVYCQPGGGYGSDCFLQFNRGSASTAAVFQDVTLHTSKGDNLTAEAMIRCPVNQAGCDVKLELSADNGQDPRWVRCTIPSNGRWYSIRLDGNHGFEGKDGFASSHRRISWALHNLGIGSLDVDFVTLADGWSRVVEGSPKFWENGQFRVPNQFYPLPSAGSACSQMD